MKRSNDHSDSDEPKVQRHTLRDNLRDKQAFEQLGNSEELPAKGWYCDTCKCSVPPEMVTHDETHDARYGGCGAPVT